ncbi:hypothetical protein KY330_03425 [Candidatus Woesearchaeota archaeon]|nr:hypothetical protein [Candidatus Woesearchaeota archaeon]
MKRGYFLICILFLLIPFVQGIGLYSSSNYVNVVYEPYAQYEFDYAVRGNMPEPRDVSVYIEGDLAEYFKIEPHYFENVQVGDKIPFKVYLTMPNTELEKGMHTQVLFADEVPPKGREANVVINARVGWPINIRVRHPGKYIETQIHSWDVEIGQDAEVEVFVHNLGSENLTEVYALVNIYDASDTLMGTLRSRTFSLPFDRADSVRVKFDTSNYNKGEYYATATVFYDGNSILTNDTQFRLGKLEMVIVNHTQKFQKDIIQKFNVTVKNDWNNKIKNVYADIKVMKDGIELDNLKTVSYDFSAWQEFNLEGYWDLRGRELGLYDFLITLHYSDLTTNMSSKIEVVESLGIDSESPLSLLGHFLTANLTLIMVILVFVLVAINVSFFFYLHKKDNQSMNASKVKKK